MTVEVSNAASNQPAAPPPHVQLIQLLMGMWIAQTVGAIARLGIADVLGSTPVSADDVAAKLNANVDGITRLLRGGAAAGVVVETSARHFALTPLGEALRSDAPLSMRDFLAAETAPGHWLPWGRLEEAVRDARPMANEALGMSAWEYYAKNAEEGLSFARAMSNLSAMVSAEVGTQYDASRFATIVDVGGSHGVLLRALLAGAPQSRGILFDLPNVIEGARAQIAASPFADRIELVTGDFLAEVPSGADLYVLKSILHDWDDDRATAILRNVRAAAKPESRILIVETMLPSQPQPSPIALMDLNMLVMLGGRERTAEQFGALLAAGGWRVERVIPTPGMFQLIEGVVA